VPLLVLHFRNLWSRPHYQFFPLVLLIVPWMICVRRREMEAVPFGEWPHRVGRFSIWLSLILLVVSLIVLSPWLTAIAALTACGGLLFPMSRSAPQSRLMDIWMATWILIPLPWSLDTRLIQHLQRNAADCCSRLLDGMGFHHLLEGTILEFPENRLFVEQACSGVQSLFSLLAFAVLYAIWHRRSWLQIIGLSACSAMLAVICNILRLLVVAVSWEAFGVDLATGWQHQAIGYALLLLFLWILTSADLFLVFVLGPFSGTTPLPSPQDFANLESRASTSIEPDDPTSIAPTCCTSVANSRDVTGRQPLVGWGTAIPFAVLGLAQILLMTAPLQVGLTHAPFDERALLFDHNALPAVLGNWKRTHFDITARSRGNEEGTHSHTWRFDGGEYQAFTSLDFPFTGSHNLSACYVNKGWKRTHMRTYDNWPHNDQSAVWKTVEFEFQRGLGEHGYLLFCLFDLNGHAVEPTVSPRMHLRQLIHRAQHAHLLALWGTPSLQARLHDTVYQFQIFVPTKFRLTPGQRKTIRSQFASLQHVLNSQWQRFTFDHEQL